MNRLTATLFAAILTVGCILPASAQQATSEAQWEQQIGQEEYQQLAQKGEIISSSPYYLILNSIAARIAPVADRQYAFPFHFILVHEPHPNAFAVPGGNVYVTDSMMRFVQNKEELAGVLCHETAHDIHHDVYNLAVKAQQTALYANIASLIFGRGRYGGIINSAIGVGYNLKNMGFTRTVEAAADYKGAITCAQAGIDPWAMVWLMQNFEAHPTSSPPEFLSDHPSDSHRIGNLENEFSSDPALFGKYNPNVCMGTPVTAAGFHYQYGTGCGTTRRQSSGTIHKLKSKRRTWKFSPHQIH